MPAIESDTGAEVAQAQTQIGINWSLLGPTIAIELVGNGVSELGTATFRARRDGSDGAADGVIVATVTASSSSATPGHGGTTISNPGGYGRIILTAQSSAATKNCSFRDIMLTIQ